MKATFFERLGAYILDAFIVSIIFSLICMGISTTETKTEKLMAELDNKLMEKKVTTEEYIEEYQILLYDYQKENILTTSISLALTIAYYIVFQFLNKGQTLGKKLLNLKVVDIKTEKQISISRYILRYILIYNLLSGILSIPLLYVLNQKTYFAIYFILLAIEMIFILINVMFILYRKDKRGLHDILTNTVVIKKGSNMNENVI